MLSALLLLASALAVPAEAVQKAFGDHPGAYVEIDCASGDKFISEAAACAEKVAPCSTFKIWNSAIGLETGVVSDPDAEFWKWDGVKRTTVAEWNADQTLRSAMKYSCVPAYQNLARLIGVERMRDWIEKIGYGDRNISSGLDVFWLPAEGRTPLLISGEEQAELIARLVNGQLPFSEKTRAVLKDIMKLKTKDKGTLYGKTGTAGDGRGNYIYGWFVGYVESGGKTRAFACRLVGLGLMGKDARAATESILAAQGLL